MIILEVLAISSAVSTVSTGVYQFYKAVRSNKYAANYARINELNAHQRGGFSDIVLPSKTVTTGHTHGDSAAARSVGSAAAASYAYSMNKVPFYLSMSASDQRAGREGERTMHWAKDFNAERRVAEPGANSMLVMIDVDEHIKNLPALLHKHFLPTIMYTFQPSVAAGVFGDYRYTFDDKARVKYTVAGGGYYEHEVWNYSPDTLVMRKKIFGLTYAKSFFTVEKRYIDENHQLVLLTPLAKFGLLGSILSYNVSGSDLERLNPIDQGFIRMEIARSKVKSTEYEHLTSTARVGTYNAATVTVAQDNAIAALARASESKLSNFQIKSTIPGIEHVDAVSLLEYHRLKKTKPAIRTVIPTDAVNNYTFNATPHIDEKPSVKPFMAPILPDCYAPTATVENEEAMVKGRITDLKKPADHLDEKHLKYAFEFCDILAKELGTLIPFEHEDVTAKLARPSQQRITEEASLSDVVPDVIKSFMKKEAYQKPTDPRPIATINGKVKYEYSAFTYAVAEALKKTSWYAFGRKPKQIAERVAQILQNAKHATKTDLSRFDGRVNRSARQFEEMVMCALFPPKYHKALLALMKKQYGAKGITRLGVKYKNSFNRQSGSPETSILNTILNVFMAYCCLREQGCEPEEAYLKLGLYGGDDGLTPDVDPVLYTKVCAKFGQVLEAEKVERGKKGVEFLSRIYSPDVWFGSTNSCADLARALSKLHVSVEVDLNATDKLYEKAYALYLTDSNTPIIGEFVSKAVELSGKRPEQFLNRMKIWNADCPLEDQYPNLNHDQWMHEVLVDQKLDGFRLTAFMEWLSECKSLDDLLKCPEFIEKPETKLAKVPIKLNDELLPSQSEFDLAVATYQARKEAKLQRRVLRTEDAPVINPLATPSIDDTESKHSDKSTLPSENMLTPESTVMSGHGAMPPTPEGGVSAGGTQLHHPVSVPTTPTTSPIGTKDRVPKPSGLANGNTGVDNANLVKEQGRGRSGRDERSSSVRDQKTTGSARPHKVRACKYGDACWDKAKCRFSHDTDDSAVKAATRKHGKETKARPWVQGTKTCCEPRTEYFQYNGRTCMYIDHHESCPQINGNNGSATNTDDHAAINREDPLLEMGADLVEAGYAFVPQQAIEVIERTARSSPFDTIHQGYIEPFVQSVVDTMEPILDYFSPKVHLGHHHAVVPQINGNNGSATNTDDHAARNPAPKQQPKKQHQEMKSAPKYQPAPPRAKQQKQAPLVTAPVAVSRRTTTREPRFKRTSKDSMTIWHSELIALVTGSANWTTTTIPIQPGLPRSMPWFATQAQGWEKYRIKSMVARYETRCGTTDKGSLLLVVDYDAADAAPLSEIAAATYHGTVDDVPWKENILRFDTRRLKEFFLRNGPLAANLDIKMYDAANLFICTTDGAATSWGKVFLDYEIELINSQVVVMPTNAGGSIQGGGTGFNPVTVFGTLPIVTPGAFVTGVTSGGSISLTNLQVGNEYYILVTLAGTGLTQVNTLLTSGLAIKSNIANDLGSPTTLMDSMTVTATATDAVITVSGTGTTVSASSFVFALLAVSSF